MQLRLSRQHVMQLLLWSKESHPLECCGLILGQGDAVWEIILTQNVADNPERSFEIEPSALIAAEKNARNGGLNILGYFHSHPNGVCQPSKEDAKQAAYDDRLWVILTHEHISVWALHRAGALHGCFEPVELLIFDNAQT